MSRESKLFNESKSLIGKRIKEYESFGWELLSINGNDVSMSRETQNKVYAELVKFEYFYEELIAQQKALVHPPIPAKFSGGLAFIGLLAGVIPGVLYIIYKIVQNNKFKQKKYEFESEYQRLEEEIKKTCADSRSTFFSRQG